MRPRPTIPSRAELLQPTLRAVSEIGGSGTIGEIDNKVIELTGLTEDQQAVLHGNGPRSEIQYQLAWSRTYLKAMGLLENSARGVWTLTDLGRHELTDGGRREGYETTRLLWPRAGRAAELEANAVQAAEAPGAGGDWKQELLEALLVMPSAGFERLAQRLLREAGFTNTTVTGRSGDGGIDGLGVYRISLVGFPVYFQCKRYRGSVGPSAVRDFRGAMAGRGDKGLLITTGSFTAEAEREARRDGVPPIDLIDGELLCELLKKYDIGVTTSIRQVEETSVRPEFFSEI
jgi:restriction system protein